jgi:hypothetical protein
MKKLKCHCGSVEAEINVDGDLEKIVKCNCSLCKRRGAVMSMVKNEDFKITKGEDKLNFINFIQKWLNITFVLNVEFIPITIQEVILQ